MHWYWHMVKNSSMAAAPPVTAEVSSCALKITLTVIEAMSRRAIFVGEVATRKKALAKFRSFGGGYDALISTPRYSELILSNVRCGSNSFSLAGSVKPRESPKTGQ